MELNMPICSMVMTALIAVCARTWPLFKEFAGGVFSLQGVHDKYYDICLEGRREKKKET